MVSREAPNIINAHRISSPMIVGILGFRRVIGNHGDKGCGLANYPRFSILHTKHPIAKLTVP